MILLLLACAPSFEADVQPVVAARCVGCHYGEAAGGGLDLSEDPYEAIVGAPSSQTEELVLVEPGDALYSYLWHKVNGTQALAGGSGTSMPLGGALSDEEIDLLADWIDAGARP